MKLRLLLAAILVTGAVSGQDEPCPVLPTKIGFDRPEYRSTAGAHVTGKVTIKPVPAAGLYSQGLQILVRNTGGGLAGFLTPAPSAKLRFDGIRLLEVSRTPSGTGAAALKTSADFNDLALPAEFGSEIGSFTIGALPPGTYEATLVEWNELGPTEDIFVSGCGAVLDDVLTFGTANIVIEEGNAVPEVTSVGDLKLERQTGLFEQVVTFTNNSGRAITGFRLYLDGLPTDVTLWNAHGIEDGVPYIDIQVALAPGESTTIKLEFFRQNRSPDFTPQHRVEPSAATPPEPNPEGKLEIDLRIVQISGKGVLVEFLTETGKPYTIEYTDDMATWKVSQPTVIGTGQRIQWLDSGLPRTAAFPSSRRFYRVTAVQP